MKGGGICKIREIGVGVIGIGLSFIDGGEKTEGLGDGKLQTMS